MQSVLPGWTVPLLLFFQVLLSLKSKQWQCQGSAVSSLKRWRGRQQSISWSTYWTWLTVWVSVSVSPPHLSRLWCHCLWGKGHVCCTLALVSRREKCSVFSPFSLLTFTHRTIHLSWFGFVRLAVDRRKWVCARVCVLPFFCGLELMPPTPVIKMSKIFVRRHFEEGLLLFPPKPLVVRDNWWGTSGGEGGRVSTVLVARLICHPARARAVFSPRLYLQCQHHSSSFVPPFTLWISPLNATGMFTAAAQRVGAFVLL